jgi:O-antigen ligase
LKYSLPVLSRNYLIYIALTLFFIGLLFNRVVHSIGIFFACVWIVTAKDWSKQLFKDGYLLSFLSLSFIVFLFDIVHAPNQIIQSTFFPKLTLVVYPLMIRLWNPGMNQVRMVLAGLILLCMVNMSYGIFHLITDYDAIIDAYKRAKVLPTLGMGDHIRMSWVTVIGIWGTIYLTTVTEDNRIKKWLWAFVITAIIYLHILSVKTGLIIFYGSACIYIFYLLKEGNFTYLVVSVQLLMIVPFAAFKFFPSLQNRIAYIVWDITQHAQGNRQAGLSDGARIASIKAGFQIGNENYISGTGHLNLKATTYRWYQKFEPKMSKADYIMPSSQFLIYFASCGIAGLLVFLIHLIIPFFKLNFTAGKYFYIIYIPSAFTFIYETHLEGQYAIFVYAFFSYLFFHFCKVQE